MWSFCRRASWSKVLAVRERLNPSCAAKRSSSARSFGAIHKVIGTVWRFLDRFCERGGDVLIPCDRAGFLSAAGWSEAARSRSGALLSCPTRVSRGVPKEVLDFPGRLNTAEREPDLLGFGRIMGSSYYTTSMIKKILTETEELCMCCLFPLHRQINQTVRGRKCWHKPMRSSEELLRRNRCWVQFGESEELAILLTVSVKQFFGSVEAQVVSSASIRRNHHDGEVVSHQLLLKR